MLKTAVALAVIALFSGSGLAKQEEPTNLEKQILEYDKANPWQYEPIQQQMSDIISG